MPRLRTAAALSLAAATSALALAAPAQAADTPVTFTLTTTGALSIAAPTSEVTLTGSALSLTGTVVSAALGATTVTDGRASLLHNVTVTMSASDFVQKDAGNNVVATIAKGAATGYSGAATGGTLTSLFVPTTAVTPASIGGTGGATIGTVVGLIGSGTVTYSPTVSVAVPATAVAGVYTGTISQTVA